MGGVPIKVLFVHVGDPMTAEEIAAGVPVIELDTFLRSTCAFRQLNLHTNVTTRQHIAARNEVMVHPLCFTDRKSLSRLIRSGFRLRRIVRQYGADLVHVYWGASSGLVVTLFSPVPAILTYGGSDLLGNYNAANKPTLSGRLAALLSQLAALFAAHVVVPAVRLKPALWPVSRSKCSIIPQGVDSRRFFPMNYEKARAFTGFADDERIVLFFPGKLSWVKDPGLAEDTIDLVRAKIPNARLFYVTKIPHEDMIYYYNAADALLLTSHHEGSNNSIKEAMCCSLPVISTDVGDARERLAPVAHSYVVPGRNPRDLAEPLIEILRGGVRSDAADYVGPLSLATCTQKNIDLYKAVLEDG